MSETERMLEQRQAYIAAALHYLVGLVRVTENSESARVNKAEFSLKVELTAGGHETWLVTVERTASSH